MLIVESDSKSREEVAGVLRSNGYTNIQLASSVSEGLDLLGLSENATHRQSRLDVDLVVFAPERGPTPFDFCRRVKASFQYEDTPIIVISTGSISGEMQMAYAFGATDFLTRPFDDSELLSRIRSALKFKHEVDRRRAREKELLEITRQLTDLNNLLARHSMIDGLTGAANRRFLDGSLAQEWRRAGRSQRPISVIMFDVDYFKQYNDRYGHQAGDACLIKIVDTIRPLLKRPSDLFARYGGEEFTAVLPETDLQGAIKIAEEFRSAIADLRIEHLDSKVCKSVTISLGVAATVPGPLVNPEDIIAAADLALYDAKRSGRNMVKNAQVSEVPLKVSGQ